MSETVLSLLANLPDIRLITGYPAARLTSFRIGGPIAYVVYPLNIACLTTLLTRLKDGGIPFRLIGCGTNVLARDEGYPGVWIVTRECQGISFRGCRAEAECGVPLRTLIDLSARMGLGGMENLYGIPGSVGGAVLMNAGAYGTSVADLLSSVTVWDLWRDRVISFSFDDCGFGYRKSVFQEGRYMILSAEFRLTPTREDLVRATMRQMSERRAASQPLDLPSAGSIFRRPVGAFAGKLISDAGLSGYRIGDIQVSEKHNGFFVNLGHGTAQDVKRLISYVQDTVCENSGVLLHPELIIE